MNYAQILIARQFVATLNIAAVYRYNIASLDTKYYKFCNLINAPKIKKSHFG